MFFCGERDNILRNWCRCGTTSPLTDAKIVHEDFVKPRKIRYFAVCVARSVRQRACRYDLRTGWYIF